MSANEPIDMFAPLRKTLQLRASPNQAFARFAERFGDWWPRAQGHSVFGAESRTCQIEPFTGGRILELANDGREAQWGRITTWHPPHALHFTWHAGRDESTAQRIEVTFTANDDGTLVTLVHHDWHVPGSAAADTRNGYDRGWGHVLGTFGAHASRAAARAVYNATPCGRVASFATIVHAPIERVFALLATAEGLDAWFTHGASLEPREGGQLVFRWRDLLASDGPDGEPLEFFGRVHVCEAPRRFVFDWQADSGAYDLRCAIELEPAGNGTKVSLRETGFRDDDVGLQDLLNRQSGWSQSLTELKAFAEHGIRLYA